MKIDIKTLNYACHQHDVQCKLNGETITVNRKEFALQGAIVVGQGTGAEFLREESLIALGSLLPESKRADVLSTYKKILRVKLAYCKTEITEVEFL